MQDFRFICLLCHSTHVDSTSTWWSQAATSDKSSHHQDRPSQIPVGGHELPQQGEVADHMASHQLKFLAWEPTTALMRRSTPNVGGHLSGLEIQNH